MFMFWVVGKWVNQKIVKRQSEFVNQLEGVLRVMASGVRAGLTIRQALVLVTEEAAEPSRYEFKLLIVQTNVGVSMTDALNRLAQRMPSPEVQMFTRTIIMQASTGGNLAKVLDSLCDTIKERRRIFRKVKTITSEARGSAYILGALPLLSFVLIMFTLPDFRGPALHSKIGLEIIGGGMVLEVLCGLSLYKLTQFRV
jgi:tight adherence protein B